MSIKSILLTSSIPIDFKFKIVALKLHLKISGTVFSSSSSYVFWSKILKHFPPFNSLPALPALWIAEFFEIGTILREFIPVKLLNYFIFCKPQSITYLIPGIVTEVSAILVDKIIFVKFGKLWNARTCSLGGMFAKRGIILNFWLLSLFLLFNA